MVATLVVSPPPICRRISNILASPAAPRIYQKIEVASIHFRTHEPPPSFHCGNGSSARPHKTVEHKIVRFR